MEFFCLLNWTQKGIENIKDSPKRHDAAKAMLEQLGGREKGVWLTSGDYDMVLHLDVPDGETMAKFCLKLGAQGGVRTKTVRAWNEAEYRKIMGSL